MRSAQAHPHDYSSPCVSLPWPPRRGLIEKGSDGSPQACCCGGGGGRANRFVPSPAAIAGPRHPTSPAHPPRPAPTAAPPPPHVPSKFRTSYQVFLGFQVQRRASGADAGGSHRGPSVPVEVTRGPRRTIPSERCSTSQAQVVLTLTMRALNVEVTKGWTNGSAAAPLLVRTMYAWGISPCQDTICLRMSPRSPFSRTGRCCGILRASQASAVGTLPQHVCWSWVHCGPAVRSPSAELRYLPI